MTTPIGPIHVRRSTFIQASPVRVWQEFGTEERIKGWLDQGHTLHQLTPAVGETADFSVSIDGVERHFGGKVLVCSPNEELTMESQWQTASEWPSPTLWTYLLTPVNSGTSVEFFHHGFEQLGVDAADNLQGYEQGWNCQHLEALRRLIEGNGES